MAECMECLGCSCGGCEFSEDALVPPPEDHHSGPTKGYYRWLLSLTGFGWEKDGDVKRTYGVLLDILYRTEFYALIANDDNRGMDGISLREDYLYKISCKDGTPSGGFVYDPGVKVETVVERIDGIDLVPQGPCRLLEMIIALVNRIVFELDDLEHGDMFRPTFWELIENLGLYGYHDDTLNEQKIAEIYKKIEKFLERKYKKNGKGGLFPLKHGLEVCKDGTKSIIGSKDQTKIELSYQMDAYIRENYR